MRVQKHILNDICALLVYVVCIRVRLIDIHVSAVSSFIYIRGVGSVAIYLNIYPIWKRFCSLTVMRCLNSVCLKKNLSNSHLRTVTCYYVVSALVFSAFLCVFWKESLTLCCLKFLKKVRITSSPKLTNDPHHKHSNSQRVMVEPQLWDIFLFTRYEVMSAASTATHYVFQHP